MKIKVLNNFLVGKNHLGKAVFAARSFKQNDVVVKFEGKIFKKSDIPEKYEGCEDRFVQISKDTFMGPSGDVDDFINHSCDPNTGLKFSELGIVLVAIKDINIGDEITWDYSTTLFENPWKMLCQCKSENCRKLIGDFILLDADIQKKYYDLNVIPSYIKEYMDSDKYVVYNKGIESLKAYAKQKEA